MKPREGEQELAKQGARALYITEGRTERLKITSQRECHCFLNRVLEVVLNSHFGNAAVPSFV